MKLLIGIILIFSGATFVPVENQNNNIDETDVLVEAESSMTTMECIAAGGCKFKLQASCVIIFCDGSRHEDDENSTVDNDKIIIIQQE